MRLLLPSLWNLAVPAMLCSARVVNAVPASEEHFEPSDIIHRDVCVLGGGSTGTYAAIRLRDKGKSVVVVERDDRLGGHSHGIRFPDGKGFDYGVQALLNDGVTNDYLDRLGLEKVQHSPSTLNSDHINFKTGERVPPNSNTLEMGSGLVLFRQAIAKFDFLDEGIFDLPDPVPQELLRPFGEFVEKHHLEGMLELIFMFAHGLGNILEVPLLYVIGTFGIPQIDALLNLGYIRPNNGVAEIYTKAASALGHDVWYQTTASRVIRSNDGVRIVVNGPDGKRKLIKAKKLLATIPPTMDNLHGFDLDQTEKDIFMKWRWNSYYASVVNNTGIPDKTSAVNIYPSIQPGSLPTKPFQWHIDYMGVSGYLASKLVADEDFSAVDAKRMILDDIQRMGEAGTYDSADPQIVKFADHTPTSMSVDAEEIRHGFYRGLYALQGQHSTYWTGHSFCADMSSLLWAYTDTVMDQMLA
ncbi:hypothetical protein FQN50_007060 [Emmonsiellopsis sp. PD_5]|nr:hypothetical protein FQN50_007060 [Emmonsiellopsis sp. PD_5]